MERTGKKPSLNNDPIKMSICGQIPSGLKNVEVQK